MDIGRGGRGGGMKNIVFICTTKNDNKNVLIVKMRHKDKKKLASEVKAKGHQQKHARNSVHATHIS